MQHPVLLWTKVKVGDKKSLNIYVLSLDHVSNTVCIGELQVIF